MCSECWVGWVSAGWVDGGTGYVGRWGRPGLERIGYSDEVWAWEGNFRLKIWMLHCIYSLAFDIWQWLTQTPGSPVVSFGYKPASSHHSPPTN